MFSNHSESIEIYDMDSKLFYSCVLGLWVRTKKCSLYIKVIIWYWIKSIWGLKMRLNNDVKEVDGNDETVFS